MASKQEGQVNFMKEEGNTSPLGTLLDHQMDSMVVICEGINVSTTV